MFEANQAFSFLILSFNDEMHIGRLLESIKPLRAAVFILDSGSTDNTLNISRAYGATVQYHPFENHPRQWNKALHCFEITTPWIVALDADQVLSPELLDLLRAFDPDEHPDLNGIYFNRKNYYKGRWIRHGGYYPFYMLKMFRRNIGRSDLNENMDHRFIVPGKTRIWKRGYLLEENLKESKIQFWLDKHSRYSDLLAREEVERMMKIRTQVLNPRLFGNPDERKAIFKMLWLNLPRFLRPVLYFSYRMTIQCGFLDGRTGIIFHFLQGFWFRLIVDVKIEEILKAEDIKPPRVRLPAEGVFIIKFLLLFLILYGFNILYIGLTTPDGIYVTRLQQHANYIQQWRAFTLQTTASILDVLGFRTKVTDLSLRVIGFGGFKLVYSCLGYGMMSFFAAFVISYPKRLASKLYMLIAGLMIIQAANIARLLLISIFWKPRFKDSWIDHHTMFNVSIYLIVIIILYAWTNAKPNTNSHVKHNIKEEIQ
jgi:exosortase/archaeosortase family protein